MCDADLGLADDERRVDVDCPRNRLELGHDVRRDLLEVLQVRAPQSVLRACGREPAATEERHFADRDTEILRLFVDDLAARPVHQVVLRRHALLRVGQQHVDGRKVVGARSIVSYRRHGEPHLGEGADLTRDALGDEARLIEPGPLGGAHLQLESSLVVHRQEPLVRLARERKARAKRRYRGNDDDPAAEHHEAKNDAVDVFHRSVEAVDQPLAERLRAGRLFLEPARRHHRRQREADQHRDGD